MRQALFAYPKGLVGSTSRETVFPEAVLAGALSIPEAGLAGSSSLVGAGIAGTLPFLGAEQARALSLLGPGQLFSERVRITGGVEIALAPPVLTLNAAPCSTQ